MAEGKVKQKMSNKKFKTIWIIVLSVVLVLALAANIAIQIFESYVNNYLGYGTYEIVNTAEGNGLNTDYNTMDFTSKEEVDAAAEAMAEAVEAEGIVLMKNNGTLPLSGTNVTMLGRDAADPIYGGSGSGGIDIATAVNARAGLENAGLSINETVYDVLAAFAETAVRADIVMDQPEASAYYIGEMPVSGYTDEAVSSFAQYNDAAIVFIGRGGGEGGDLARDMSGWDDNYTAGQHQLELNKDEKDMLELAKANFDNVVVVVNASSAMELGILEDDDDIDAVIWVGSPGQVGFNAVGKVLTGEVNPSGRTADIYPRDFTKDPTFVNFGHEYEYSNMGESKPGEGFSTYVDGYFFVQYEEGIYYGYRYYETAAEEGFIDYDEAVVYPFGHGLSYTSFDWEIDSQSLPGVDGTISIDVKVTNTGSVAGKEVVQLYYSAPYTPGGIEKAHVVLGDFAKTGELAPGESEVVTLEIAVEEMASYDYKNAEAYVLDAGDYELLVQTDSHNLKDGIEPIVYTVNSTVTYTDGRATDKVAVTNQFDDISALFVDEAQDGYILNMSRADFAGTFPTAPTAADKVANDDITATWNYDVAAQNAAIDVDMPTTGADNGLGLIDLRGKDLDDPLWEDLLDQLTVDEMLSVILNGAYHTEAINSIVKPYAADYDGPAGFTTFMGSLNCTAYPSAVVIASTFNKDLIYDMGVSIGNEGLANNIHGWYAPAMNIHRSPFAGRNFEYYSEDPVLSGKLAQACVDGAASKGVYSFIKHYAVNDQESHRVDNGVATWVNEQAMREIYLKPFEIVVKNATSELAYLDENGQTQTRQIGATALMSSFNRIGNTWAGGSYALMNTVLRDEWGFEGMVITDFNLYPYMVPDQSIYAGTDLMLTFTPMKTMEDTTSAAAVSNIRNAMKNILYTVANSSAMNGIAPGASVVYRQPTWRTIQIVVDVVLALLWLCAVAWVVIRVKKHKNDPVETKAKK